MPQLTYEMQTRQQIGLMPRLQQAVKLLQMSALDCRSEIFQAIANNPFLEDSADDVPEVAPRVADAPPQRTADWSFSHDSGIQDVGIWAPDSVSLQDIMRSDLCGYTLSARERALSELIIDALDQDGYLRSPFSELADAEQFSPCVEQTEWMIALRLVQHIGTPGLAARNLSECLTLQLNALSADTPGRALALRIVQQALEYLGRHDYHKLKVLMNSTESAIEQACSLIRTLDPRPGARYAALDASCYVTADAIVRRAGKSWIAAPAYDAASSVRLNNAYVRLFRDTSGGDRSLMVGALQEARWLLRSLEQRSMTIQRVAQAIVARQQTFFDYGAIALRPLMLSEIADELELHESTVSRATSNKYLACPAGLFEFKHFFSRELGTRTGGTCSATSVRALIQEMIKQENPRQPLSDVELASLLAGQGVLVARRTVSKYRAQLKFPAADMRRSL